MEKKASRTDTDHHHHDHPLQKNDRHPISGTQESAAASAAAKATTAASSLRSLSFCLPQSYEPDVLSEFLMEVGACAVSPTDAMVGTHQEQAIFGEPEIVFVGDHEGSATATYSTYTPHAVWKLCNVTALFPNSINLTGIVKSVEIMFPFVFDQDQNHAAVPVRLRTVENRDWLAHVQQSWKPVVVGRFVLKFPWHDEDDVRQALKQQQQLQQQQQIARVDKGANNSIRIDISNATSIVLELQGGAAFGTGEHATTQLCLQWIDAVVQQHAIQHPHTPFQVLDYGSGSGILGMAACAIYPWLVSSVGIDIDVDACRIANENARRNHRIVHNNMRNYLPPLSHVLETNTPDNAESQSLLLKAHYRLASTGSSDNNYDDLILPQHLDQRQFPIVVANILAAPLIQLAPTLVRRLAPGGTIGMSGILQHQAQSVITAYVHNGLEDAQIHNQKGDWVLITGVKRCEYVQR